MVIEEEKADAHIQEESKSASEANKSANEEKDVDLG